MTDILKQLADLSSRKYGLCPVGRLLASLDEETQNALVSALSSRASTREIHLALQRSGLRIGRDSVSNHRNNQCICEENPNV